MNRNLKYVMFAIAGGFFTAAMIFPQYAMNNVAFGVFFTIAGIVAVVKEKRPR